MLSLAAVTRLALWPCALIMFVVTRIWSAEISSLSCRCYTPSAMSQTNKHVGLKYGLLCFYSFSCDNLVSTLTICLTCARPLCVRELLMVLISDIVSPLLLIIRPNHWVSLRSFIPPCNQRQFVTMPNEKIPVSSGSYLPITRCLTAACLPCTMARMTRSGASFPHSRF